MRMNHNSVISSIHEFVEGNLNTAETDKLWAHLISDSGDLEYLQTLATLKKMGQAGQFENLMASEQSSETTILPLLRRDTFGGKFRQYLAAAVVVVMSMGILYNIISTESLVSTYSPISMIEYNIERSADDVSQFERYLQQAVSQSSTGNLPLALQTLETASEFDLNDHQIIDLNLVKGAVLYNSGEYESARTTFVWILDQNPDNLSLEKSYWYLANTQLQLGLKNDAVENIQNVIALDGSFSRVAQKALNSLQ